MVSSHTSKQKAGAAKAAEQRRTAPRQDPQAAKVDEAGAPGAQDGAVVPAAASALEIADGMFNNPAMAAALENMPEAERERYRAAGEQLYSADFANLGNVDANQHVTEAFEMLCGTLQSGLTPDDFSHDECEVMRTKLGEHWRTHAEDIAAGADVDTAVIQQDVGLSREYNKVVDLLHARHEVQVKNHPDRAPSVAWAALSSKQLALLERMHGASWRVDVASLVDVQAARTVLGSLAKDKK
jgi:hypothetical protein